MILGRVEFFYRRRRYQIKEFLKNIGSNFILKGKKFNLRLKSAGEPLQRASQQRHFLTGGRGGIRPEQGGGGEIRTHGRVSSTLALQASTLNHSVTPPLYTG